MSIQSQLDQVLSLLDKAVPVNGWRFVESMKRVVEQSAADTNPSDDPPIMARLEVWHRWLAELGYTTKEGYQPPEQVVISAEDAKTIANFLREHGPAIRAAVGGEAVAVKEASTDAFHDGVILALQVLNASGDCGSADYVELVNCCGLLQLVKRAKAEGMMELSGLAAYLKDSRVIRDAQGNPELAALIGEKA